MENQEQHYALIKENKVQNIIVADDDFIKIIKNDYNNVVRVDELRSAGIFVAIGWDYIDGGFVIPEVVQAEQE